MQALNAQSEYREYVSTTKDGADLGFDKFVDNKIGSGEWIEDDGDYYLPEVWATQYDEPCGTCWGIIPDPAIHYVPEDGTLCECGAKA